MWNKLLDYLHCIFFLNRVLEEKKASSGLKKWFGRLHVEGKRQRYSELKCTV